ncbi:VacJ family lipoprotein [Spongiibacter sp.]|uniref:MlaA family lipoprotein n=1 Tax=Spongiibacter sp. TaxID=2024860 RepID=UPI003562EBED
MFLHRLLSAVLCLLAPLAFAGDYGNDLRDPWEGFNRHVFAFNEGADRYVAKPVAKAYKKITPSFIDQGIGNVFNNIGEIKNLANDVLQGEGVDALVDASRFFINTTVGVLGFFDVASHLGLERESEDFGQTLAVWGVGNGPYLMLPLLGPSTLRDGSGRVVDSYTSPLVDVNPLSAELGLLALDLVQVRAKLLGSDELVSGDKYTFIKDAYLQRRQFLINDGQFQDSFGDEDFESFDF